MAKKRKNSNYVTPKTIAAKEAMDAAKRRLKIKRIAIPISVTLLAVALTVGLVFLIGAPLGLFEKNPST